MQSAVDLATTFGAVVLAAAGNDGNDLATEDVIPCELDRVICVGSVDGMGQNVFNYGESVDIWAPTNVYSTVTPDSASTDNNDVGADELYRFGGTSASTPFVAGIVGLMKALDPSLHWDRVQDILQQTANDSSDERVAGYVDAYRAVQAVRENLAPSVVITRPSEGDTISYRANSFRADASDPENDNPESGMVTWSSDIDGVLCVVEGFYFASLANQCNPVLSLGTHVITANATDLHGASMQDAVTVEAINHPPTIHETQFPPGTSFFSNQTVTLRALANDVDEGPPFAQDRLSWSSDLDGVLGLGLVN
jgi:subtilisin family serine protease